MSTWYSDNLLRFLPMEYEIRDAQYGDLADFLKIIAIPLDEFSDFIEEFTSIFDVDTCEAKYLPYLAKMLNYPLSDRDDEQSKRMQLKNAVEWYKRKGLHEGFRILFYSLGYVINLVELWTRDYENFERYPGTWTPPVFHARIVGYNVNIVTITDANKYLRLSIDGSQEILVQLTTGLNRFLIDIAAEIDAALDPFGGDCYEDISGNLVIESRTYGETSIVRLIDIPNSAYQILGFTPGIYYGIDYEVPSDWPELYENGGAWYKSPHFGIEVYSIRGFVTDPEEFDYVRERVELIRPAHTVLDYIKYAKLLSDVLEVTDDAFIGEIESKFAEIWPYPICRDRGVTVDFEHIRDGLVPYRHPSLINFWKHTRYIKQTTAPRRDSFEYIQIQISRGFPSGPPQMATRDAMLYARDGYYFGEPRRSNCLAETDTLEGDITFDPNQVWCANVTRNGGGFIDRSNPAGYLRDGELTRVTWRGQCEFTRTDEEGAHDDFTRFECKPPIDAEMPTMFFTRPDLPGVWFPNLVALNDPDLLGPGMEIPGGGDSPLEP